MHSLADYAFGTMGLRRIAILMRKDNMPSKKVAEGAGLKLELEGKEIAAQSPKEIYQMGLPVCKGSARIEIIY